MDTLLLKGLAASGDIPEEEPAPTDYVGPLIERLRTLAAEGAPNDQQDPLSWGADERSAWSDHGGGDRSLSPHSTPVIKLSEPTPFRASPLKAITLSEIVPSEAEPTEAVLPRAVPSEAAHSEGARFETALSGTSPIDFPPSEVPLLETALPGTSPLDVASSEVPPLESTLFRASPLEESPFEVPPLETNPFQPALSEATLVEAVNLVYPPPTSSRSSGHVLRSAVSDRII
ncbi:hypothetical protein CALCODRAFT_485591 [Calocera cornea HHB12733]|uniref:Uncharacterized protein n=1 Tax=Calocera cornea HHB12733 TaxID=1353952 RepID=A0A165E9I9_9BASI|nr:hypothetical protein CALCODRAFT_485591 [Calocera cornea HHB12733]